MDAKKRNMVLISFLVIVILLVAAVVLWRINQSRTELVLGAIMPLTGDLATYGRPVKEGMETAVAEINSSGGIAGKPVKIVFEDDAGNPTQAVNAFQKLVDYDMVPIVLGPLTSGASLATAPIAESRKVVQLSTIAGTIKLSDAGDYVFRLFPSDEFQGAYIGEAGAETFKSKRAAIVYVKNAYGEGIKGIVRKAYVAKGGTIVGEESVPEGGTDFNAQIAKVRLAKPDLIFGLLYYNEGAQFLVQLKQQRLDVRVLGGDAWFGPIGQIAGDAARLLVFSSVAFGPNYADSPKMQSFISGFRAKHGYEPDSYCATGYDAVYAAKYAIDKSGFSSEQIKNSLYHVEFDGALGRVKFNSNGDNVGAKFSLFKIENNKAVPYLNQH